MSDEVIQDQPQVNIAEMLAKEGIKTDDSPIVVSAQNNTPPVVPATEPPKEGPKTPETAVNVPPVEAPMPEQPKPEPAAAPAPALQQPTQQVEVDWRDLLKKQPEVDVLKAVGLDDKMISFLSKWRSGESLKDYLEAVTMDYTKLAPEELLRQHLKDQFGSLSADDFEEVYKMKVIEQYKLDPDLFSETEVRRGKLLLGIDADKIRQDMMKRQQELLFTKPPEPGPSAVDIEAQQQLEQREKDLNTYKNLVASNEYTKDLVNTRFLKIGEGEKAFNLEVTNPNEVLDLLYDSNKWAQKLWNADGSPNVRKQLIIGAIANDDTSFFSNLTKHYEMLGEKNIADKIQNASEPTPGTPSRGSAESSDFVAQLARFGTVSSGD